MIELLCARPAQLLAETLIHFLWQGTVLVLLLKLADPIFASNSKRYLASVAVLLLMLAMPIATYGLLIGTAQGDVSLPVTHNVADLTRAESLGTALLSQDLRDMLFRAQPVFVGFWIFGVVLLGVRLLVGYVGTVWLRRDCRPLTGHLAERAHLLRQCLGVTARCRVFLSERVDEAIAVGYFKPLVMVPLAWANELPASVLEAVIAHELAHIRRCDLWVTLLQRLAETLLFYHPAVWWLSRRLTVERELCCDELAVSATQSRIGYVQALEVVARRMRKPSLTLAMSFFGGGNMNLLQRVRNVLKNGSSHEASDWWPAGFVALIAPAIAALALSGWSPLAATALADDDDDKREVESSDVKVLKGRPKPEEVRAIEGKLEALKRFAAKVRDEDDGDDDDADDGEEKEKRNDVRKRYLSEPVKEEPYYYELKRRTQKKPASDKDEQNEIDFSDFQPETAREEKLMAVIKKLQAKLKESNTFDKGPVKEEAKRNYELEVKKYFLEKLQHQAAEQKRAAVEKEWADRKALEAEKRNFPAVEKKPVKQPKEVDKSPWSDKPDVGMYRKKFEAANEQSSREKNGFDKAAKESELKKLQQALELKEAQLRKTSEALKRYEEVQELRQKEAPGKKIEFRKLEVRKPGTDKDDDDKDGKTEKRRDDDDDKESKAEKRNDDDDDRDGKVEKRNDDDDKDSKAEKRNDDDDDKDGKAEKRNDDDDDKDGKQDKSNDDEAEAPK